MAELADLMRANLLEVFGEHDGERRRAAIARVHHPEVEFSDHTEVVIGHAALDAAIERLHARIGELPFRPAGDVQLVGDLGYLPWEFGPEGQAPIATGADIAFARDGRIAKLYVVLTSR